MKRQWKHLKAEARTLDFILRKQDGSTLAHVAVEGDKPVDTIRILIAKDPSILGRPDYVRSATFDYARGMPTYSYVTYFFFFFIA